MLSNRTDLTVIWDIRVEKTCKGKGIYMKLCEAIIWGLVETQNINVKACMFYQKQGFIFGEINQYAYYPESSDEVMHI